MARVVVTSFWLVLRRAKRLLVEVAMQTFALVIFSLVGMATIAALSMALYRMLPASILERASSHGRFTDLGASDRQPDNAAGAARPIESNTLQGQSV
jgi:hypothetical protein